MSTKCSNDIHVGCVPAIARKYQNREQRGATVFTCYTVVLIYAKLKCKFFQNPQLSEITEYSEFWFQFFNRREAKIIKYNKGAAKYGMCGSAVKLFRGFKKFTVLSRRFYRNRASNLQIPNALL